MRRFSFSNTEGRIILAACVATLVAMVVSMVYVDRINRRGNQQVAAYEVAHQLVLQFLDNPTQMPDSSRPMAADVDGRTEMFWFEVNQSDANLPPEEQIQHRTTSVKVDVYLDERGRRAATPLASISRVFDPFAGAEDDPNVFMKHLEEKFADNPEVQALLQSMSAHMAEEQQMKNQQSAPPAMQQPTPPSEAPPK